MTSEVITFKVIWIFFSHKNTWLHFRRPCFNPLEPYGLLLWWMDGWMCFFGLPKTRYYSLPL